MRNAPVSKSDGRRKSNLPTDKVQRHLIQIRDAYADYNKSFIAFVRALADARAELGKETLDKEIAAKLGISKATMSRHMTVAACSPLVERLPKLPKAMCALYPLARMREIQVKLHEGDEAKADDRFVTLLDSYNAKTKTADIEKELKKLEVRLSNKERAHQQTMKTDRRNLVLKTSGREISSDETRFIGWNELAQTNDVFFTVLMMPSKEDLTYINQEKIVEGDVAEMWDIARYRSPSQADNVIGLVYCQAHYLLGGIKLLHASGFRYHSLITPTSAGAHLQSEWVLLLGGRGNLKDLPDIAQHSLTDEDGAISIAKMVGKAPRLLIGRDKEEEGWTCTVPPPAV